MDNPFEAAYWNQLQTTLWFYTRSRLIVRLAADPQPVPPEFDDDDRDDPPGFADDADLIGEVVPGGRIRKLWRSRLRTDLSFEDAEEQVLEELRRGRLRASGRKNGEGVREQIPQQEWPGLQFYWGRPREWCQHLPQSVNCSRRYVGPWDRSRANVPHWTDLLFEREQVLALLPDPIRILLRTTTEPVTLAQAVALLVRERPASKEVWSRLRRMHGGRFPAAVKQRIEDAGNEFVQMLRKGEIAAKGRLCDRDRGTEGKDPQLIATDSLDESLWVDPCTDRLWTEPGLDDGRFNPIDRGYRDVLLRRAQSPETQEAVAAPAAPPTATPEARKAGGRPSKPYKEKAIEVTVKWLDYEGEQPQAEIVRHLGEIVANLDDQGGASATTLKDWAKEALVEFRRRRAGLGGN